MEIEAKDGALLPTPKERSSESSAILAAILSSNFPGDSKGKVIALRGYKGTKRQVKP
jgi:hypothetical protein